MAKAILKLRSHGLTFGWSFVCTRHKRARGRSWLLDQIFGRQASKDSEIPSDVTTEQWLILLQQPGPRGWNRGEASRFGACGHCIAKVIHDDERAPRWIFAQSDQLLQPGRDRKFVAETQGRARCRAHGFCLSKCSISFQLTWYSCGILRNIVSLSTFTRAKDSIVKLWSCSRQCIRCLERWMASGQL